jgi:hypothetical protein
MYKFYLYLFTFIYLFVLLFLQVFPTYIPVYPHAPPCLLGSSMPHLLISLQKYIPCFLVDLNRKIQRFSYIIFQFTYSTAQKTHGMSITKENELLLLKELVAVHCENHAKNVNASCGQTALLNVTSGRTYN